MKGQHVISIFVLVILLLTVTAHSASTSGNLLIEPSFEDWTKTWTRFGTHAGSTQWDSRWIKRDDGHTGPGFIMAVKHDKLEPLDGTTPVDVYFYQNVEETKPGSYEAALWFRAGGKGDRWDGPGGVDQWTQLTVYLFADHQRTKLVRTITSPKIEIPVLEWHKFSVRFDAPAGVRSASFYACARLVDRYPDAWVTWDDAYLGPPTASRQERRNLLANGDFEARDIKPAFEIEGDPAGVSLDPSTKRTGVKALKIERREIGGNYVNQTVPLDCREGFRRVRIGLDCKLDHVVRGKQPWYGVREIIWFQDGEGKPVKRDGPDRQDILPFLTGTRDWTHFERTIIVPNGAEKLHVQIGMDGASGTVWIDNARIEEAFEDYLADEDSAVKIRVGQKATARVVEGFGWNWETVSPERHSALEIALWPELFERMAWDGPEMLRVPVSPMMCPPKEYVRGKDTGQPYTFDFDTPQIKNVCRLLEFCDAHGIDALIANWHAGIGDYPGVPNGEWLQKGYYDSTGNKNPDWLVPYSKQRMAEYIATLVHYLRVTRGHKSVKYVSVWNEPGYWSDIGQYPDGIVDIYRLLDAQLKAKGVRHLVKTLGTEMVEWGDTAGRTAEVVSNAPFIDVAAVHNYGTGPMCATATTASYVLDDDLAAMEPTIKRFAKMRETGVPFMMTETNGCGTDLIFDPRQQYIACLGAAEYAIELVKRGVGGVLKWQYNQPGWLQFCPFRIDDQHARPNPWTYYPWAMLTRWAVRGSQVLDTNVGGGLDAFGKKRVRAVALKAPGGQVTLIVTNDGRLPKSLAVTLPCAGKWRQFSYDGTLPESIRERKLVRGGTLLKATLPAESVNVFTTFDAGLTGDAPR